MLRKPMQGRRVGILCLFSLGLCLLSTPNAFAEPTQAPIFIRNLTIEVKPGQQITGSILIENGVIRDIGKILPPKDAQVIDGKGLHAYAGFIDAWTHLGFAEAKPAEEKREERESTPPDLQSNPPITMPLARRKGLRPSYQTASHYKPPKELAGHRKAGFTTALVAPKNGYFSGVSSVIQLRAGKRREVVFRSGVALHASFFSGGAKGYPSTAMGVMSHFRQFLSDAKHHKACRDAFKRASGGLPRPLYDPDLEFMDQVLEGHDKKYTLPVFFSASKENEILRAITLAEEFDFTLVLTGANQAHRHAKTIVKKRIRIIGTLDWPDEPKMPASIAAAKKKLEDAKKGPVKKKKIRGPFSAGAALGMIAPDEAIGRKDPNADKVDIKKLKARLAESPRVYKSRKKAWDIEVRNLVTLHKAGVPLALSSRGLKNPSQIYSRVQTLIKNGFPEKEVVAALTVNPATMLGIQRNVGTLEKGKLANITILSSSIGKKGVQPRFVIIDGVLHDYPKAKKVPDGKKGKKGQGRRAQRKGKTPPPKKGLSLTGTWSINIGNGRLQGTLKLIQNGQVLSGSIQSPFGLAKLTGSVNGKAVKFTAVANVQGQEIELKATGSLKGDTLSGSLSSPMGPDTEWTAKRKPGGGKHSHEIEDNDKPLSDCGCGGDKQEGDDR
jgi:imidazolonepropionase-like amidohydrolase